MPVNKLLPLNTGNVIPVITPFVIVAAAVAYPVPENTNVGADVKLEPPVVIVIPVIIVFPPFIAGVILISPPLNETVGIV